MYQVKEVAQLAGVSARTLHHYDRIGLLKPASLSPAGYRLYTNENLEKLQQILFFKELGLTLQEIKEILARPDFNRAETLKHHRELLFKKKKRIEAMINTVEKTIGSLEGGILMNKSDMFNGFDKSEIEAHQRKYATEARQKYGEEMVEKVEERTSSYSSQDWNDIQSETEAIFKKIAFLKDKGAADPQVQQEVEKWRQLITDHFYDCTAEIFRGLGDLYVDDKRFTKNIDKYGEGLAVFLREAIIIYCNNHTN